MIELRWLIKEREEETLIVSSQQKVTKYRVLQYLNEEDVWTDVPMVEE